MPRPFDGPLHTEPRLPLESDTKGVAYTCPTSPWCRGPQSRGWAGCSRGCRSCHPRERRRRAGEHLRGEHDA
jgi:hypothetical protein